MTWQQLADFINNQMVEEQRQQDVTIHVQSMDEFFSAVLEITGEGEDVLDPNSYYLDAVE